ncbi:L-histidine N(alpha)-methyltransferase [Sinorhizobium americanum]|uniref:L-histidine N(alpha)-methyltransferase n=1 Tax=Sinorhizobium americanum TaxID=194963 RepID=UPI000A661468|nr:L-histidine N(alpha)-methyltransferase [Sinorhizobium americanum]
MSFLETSLELFQQRYSPELGPEQYAKHTGVDRNGNSMSGALLWAKAETQRIRNALDTGTTNMVDAEIKLAQDLRQRVRDYVQWYRRDERSRKGVSVLEYGPGTVRAFQQKTLPLVTDLRGEASRCVLVDRSNEFLGAIAESASAFGSRIDFIRDDIFSGRRYFFDDEAAFVVMFGRTFGNLAACICDTPPTEVVVQALKKISSCAKRCWVAISIGSDLRKDAAKAYYEAHPEFQLNVFYRMKAELPVDGNFDPEVFEYEADIRGDDEFLQVVHTAVVKRNSSFCLKGGNIRLLRGDRLHLKNSFSFSRPFFEQCAHLAGLASIDVISDNAGSDIHVLEKAT